MKKLYCFPIADVCLLTSEDVLTASGIVDVLRGDGQSVFEKIAQVAGEGDKLNLNW